MEFRQEWDSVGVLDVPKDAYYGVQTLRAFNNFQTTGVKVNLRFIKNVALIKKVAADLNCKIGAIDEKIAGAIITAVEEILEGKFDGEFITDAVQGGAGTSINMNVNEVIANRATELLGGRKGEYLCHPNDHVNKAQSTNDVIPTAAKMTALDLGDELLIRLAELISALEEKAVEFENVVKMGRTQLQDAVPIRLGREFQAYATALKRDERRIVRAMEELHIINLGGTAIGTSVNADKRFVSAIAKELSKEYGERLKKADNLVDATQNADAYVAVSGALKTCAVTLSKMCNDLRLMSSGPKTGLAEINLPAKQNGSSIMPGKINPVIPEVVNQVAFLVAGNDVTIAMAAEGGQFELNAFGPIIYYKLFESLNCLTGGIATLTENCIKGITANAERCRELLDGSVGIVTALCPYLGYKKSAELAKEALKTGESIKSLVLKYGLLDEKTAEKVLDPFVIA